jgi:transposase-like protein
MKGVTDMDKYTTRDFDRDFPDDNACLEWIFKNRWPEGVTCEKCAKVTPHYRIAGRPCYSCEFCGSQVYPMAGTIFQDSHLPLRTWFYAFAQMAVTRCGISARQLGRDLGVRPNTALRMWGQIRSILNEGGSLLQGKVEVDETYVGGKRQGKRGRGAEGKTIVMGMVERGGSVVAKVVPNVKARTLLPVLQANVSLDAIVYTDDLLSYRGVAKLGYTHRSVAHSQGQYVLAKDIHTNNIEGFWSQLKRSIDGTYHHVTSEHLQGYVNEYAFRYSHRHDDQPMFWTMLGQVVRRAS